MEYKLNTPLLCNVEGFKLPEIKEEDCSDKCDAGYVKDISTDNKKRCIPCGDNEYSNELTDFNKCDTCPEGYIAPRIYNITKFHLVHTHGNNVFCENKCEGMCLLNKGWQFRKDGIIPGNNLPDDIKLIILKNVNILLETGGYIQLSYEIFDIKEEECFSIVIDSVKQGKIIYMI